MPPEPHPNGKYEDYQFEPINHLGYKGLIPVLHQGTALSLISRKIIEQVPFRNFHGVCQDTCLSIDLAKKGIKQYVDLRVRTLHLKINDWIQWRISEVGKEKAEMVFEPKGAYRINGSLMYLDKHDSLHLKENRVYEPAETELIKKILKPDWTCLDIGAHIGYFTLLMAQQCKEVIAFEAEPRNAATLVMNIKLNKLENVKSHCLIVGDHHGWSNLYLCDKDTGMHRVYPSKWCTDITISIPIVALDSTYSKIDFIKMDIEGSEMSALKGMQPLLEINHPILLL